MKILFSSIIIILSLFGLQAFALPTLSIPQKAEQLPEQDRLIYYSVSAMCEREESRSYVEKSSLWVNAFTDSSLIANLAKRTNPLAISQKFQSMTSSTGFHLALERCYGDDETQKSLFFFTLLSIDISGKFSVWISEVTLMKAVYFGLRGVYAAGFSTMPQRWTWFRFFFSVIMNQKLAWKMMPSHLLLAAFTAETSSEFYLEFRKARDQQNLMSGQTKEKIEFLQEENKVFQEKIITSHDSKEIKLYKIFISQNQREIDEIRRSMK